MWDGGGGGRVGTATATCLGGGGHQGTKLLEPSSKIWHGWGWRIHSRIRRMCTRLHEGVVRLRHS